MKKYLIIIVLILLMLCNTACSKQQSATNNNKLSKAQSNTAAESNDNMSTANESDDNALSADETAADDSTSSIHEGYGYNIEEDRKTFDADNINIVVGDNYYATQINDWYANFSQYEGKTVEIEGYYIADDQYTFVGRFGPSCPYCSGGYVCFEFHTNENLSYLKSDTDWVKVKGILRQGKDSSGIFYYIEAISIEKGEVGKDTVKN